MNSVTGCIGARAVSVTFARLRLVEFRMASVTLKKGGKVTFMVVAVVTAASFDHPTSESISCIRKFVVMSLEFSDGRL